MINENTPDKLAEIIRDTWPGLFMRPKRDDDRPLTQDKEDVKLHRNVHQGP